MANKVGDFFIDILVDAASGNLSVKQLIAAMGDLEVASLGGTYGLTKIAGKIADVAKVASDASVDLMNLKAQTGADPHQVQQWEMAAKAITGHSVDIRGEIQSITDQMSKIKKEGGPLGMLTGNFSVGPWKDRARGVMKSFFDVVDELSKSKKFMALPIQDKEYFMQGVFKDAKSMGLVFEAMKRGEFRPGDVNGLTDKQIENYAKIGLATIKIEQLMQSIVDHLLLNGGALLETLNAARDTLITIDKAVSSKTGTAVEKYGLDLIGNQFKFGPILGLGKTFYDIKKDIDKNAVRHPGRTLLQNIQADFGFDVTVKNEKGDVIGKQKFRHQKSISHGDVDHASATLGTEGSNSKQP